MRVLAISNDCHRSMFYWHHHINSISIPGKLRDLVNHPYLYWRNSAQKEAPLVSQMGLLLLKWFPVITSPRSLFSKLRVIWRELAVPALPHPTHLPPSLSFILSPLNIGALHTLETGFSVALPWFLGFTFAFPHWHLHHCLPCSGEDTGPTTPGPQAAQWYNTAHGPQRLQARSTLFYTGGSAQPPRHLPSLQKPWVVIQVQTLIETLCF